MLSWFRTCIGCGCIHQQSIFHCACYWSSRHQTPDALWGTVACISTMRGHQTHYPIQRRWNADAATTIIACNKTLCCGAKSWCKVHNAGGATIRRRQVCSAQYQTHKPTQRSWNVDAVTAIIACNKKQCVWCKGHNACMLRL